MKYIKKELIVPKNEAEEINKILHTKPKSWDECFGSDDIKSYTVNFGDGIEMDIKVCGVEYEEDESNLPWTEAVLFKHGHEICCSEPEEEFFGEWELEYDGTTYKVEVKAEQQTSDSMFKERKTNITEQDFKIVLNSLWRCFVLAAGLVDTLKSVGLSVNHEASGMQSFDNLYDIQEQIGTVIDFIGADRDVLGSDTVRKLTFGEEVIQFMFNIYDICPKYIKLDKFPEVYYSSLLKLFTDAGFMLPWEKDSVQLLGKYHDKYRRHRAVSVKDNTPVVGYLWVGADYAYITPYNQNIGFDEKSNELKTHAVEVYKETIAMDMLIEDDNMVSLFEGDTVRIGDDIFILNLMDMNVLQKLSSSERKEKGLFRVKANYEDFMLINK